jgi:N-carbamoylputrescine amidase
MQPNATGCWGAREVWDGGLPECAVGWYQSLESPARAAPECDVAVDRAPSFSLALLQMRISERVGDNLARAEQMIAEAARSGAQVICLPELFGTRYFCQHEDEAGFDLAEPIPGPTSERLGNLARRLSVAIVASLFERRAPGLYHNTVVVIDGERGLLGRYRKVHIPDDPGFQEKFYFTPGDLGFRVFDTSHGRVGTLICWDQWFPEAARLTAMGGADVIVYPTAIGWHPREKAELGQQQLDAWQTVQRGHAISNGVYVAAVNRVGLERTRDGDAGIEFWGSSFVADPQGLVVAQASASEEGILMSNVERGRIESIRRGWPFWRDRRVDAYGDLTRRYGDDESKD